MNLNFLKRKNSEKRKKTGAMPARDLEISEQAFRDWKYLLAAFAVLLLFVVVANGFLFMRISRGGLFTVAPDPEVNVATSNRKALSDVHDFFEARQKEYESFLTGTSTEVDPSL